MDNNSVNINNFNNGKILVVDDDKNVLKICELYLKKEGYGLMTCERGDTAVQVFDEFEPDLMILDIMLPGMDGWKVLGEIRKKSNVPVIMLTGKGETNDKILGLELGADDYMVKPFDAKELIARVRAVLRRISASDEAQIERRIIELDGLTISMDDYVIIVDGNRIEMPKKEMELLYFLASRKGKVFTRGQLLDQVWGFGFFGDTRTVDVHIKRLREKLGDNCRWAIHTVWGVGYKFKEKEDE